MNTKMLDKIIRGAKYNIDKAEVQKNSTNIKILWKQLIVK